jgi:hypothetical protein
VFVKGKTQYLGEKLKKFPQHIAIVGIVKKQDFI